MSMYESLVTHRVMLRDRHRTEAYREATARTVRPGDTVLDFGAGTGILSIFAAQAGAAQVYAVERTGAAHFARALVARNGLESSVTVLQGAMESIRLPARVDVIVSEWLGTYGVDENLLAPLLLARDRWLKPAGRMIPERVTAWMAPVWDEKLDAEMSFWRSRPYGVDLSPVSERQAHELCWQTSPVHESALLAEPQMMWSTDAYSFSTRRSSLPFRASLAFATSRPGRCNALTAWFRADMGAGVVLTNAPGAPETHWGCFLFPLQRPVEVVPDTPVMVEFGCLPADGAYSHAVWSVRVGDSAWEHHDSRGSRGPQPEPQPATDAPEEHPMVAGTVSGASTGRAG